MPTNDLLRTNTDMASSGVVSLRDIRMPSSPNDKSNSTVERVVTSPSPTSFPFSISTYTRILQQMTKLYSSNNGEIINSLAALGTGSQLSSVFPGLDALIRLNKERNSDSSEACENVSSMDEQISPPSVLSPHKSKKYPCDKIPMDLSSPGLKSVYSNCKRIKMNQIKPKIVEDVWVESDVKLTWTDSKIAAYNPAQKLFMCIDCESVGFLSRVAEHWLGAHANLRVFNCPRCPYTSAWSRCVKMHLTRQHNEQFADTNMWKENTSLMEVTQMMQELRTNVENKIDATNSLSDKRFYCPHCPYATDRRDLYTRHENIHKDDKPFHCYVCFKQFNRADHVKKHFVRMHPENDYDISKIRKHHQQSPSPSKSAVNSELSSSSSNESNNSNISSTPRTLENNAIKQNQPAISEPYLNNSSSNSLNEETTMSNKAFQPPRSIIPKVITDLPVIDLTTTPKLTTLHHPSSTIETHRPKKRGDRAFTCPYCQWSGTDNWCLKRHMNTHIKPFACILCDYKAARAERLSTHVWKVHSKRVCSKCNYLADTQELLLEHTREEHHNNPYSRRHICTSCGMSFDTRANLETHVHLSHYQSRLSEDIVQITPITLPENATSVAVAEDLSIRNSGEPKNLSLICPIEECSLPFETSAELADHVKLSHGGVFSSRCPHCTYSLTKDEVSKDHWLTHHDDVCNACVHVFTSVYGPQLWKKVHARSHSEQSPLNSIVSGLNKRKADSEIFGLEEKLNKNSSSVNIFPSSPASENPENEPERNSKRQRKQSYPKKVIAIDESEPETSPFDTIEIERKKSVIKPFLETATVPSFKPPFKADINSVTSTTEFPRKLKRKIRCSRCPTKPVFKSFIQFKMHKKLKHKIRQEHKLLNKPRNHSLSKVY